MYNLILFLLPLLCLCLHGILKGKKLRICCSLFQTLSAVIALLVFLRLQNASGGADAGREIAQRILPALFFLLLGAHGLFAALRDSRKA